MNHYEWKLERRRQRLEARAERLAREGRARLEHGKQMFSVIPFGQPILIGHHSEKSDRRYRERARNHITKGYSLLNEAGATSARAEAVGSGGISSDDPEAIAKLREQLPELEARQAMMAKANRVVRAFWKAGKRADAPAGELETYFAQMAAAGVASASVARQLLAPDFAGRIGYADYQLQNNGANIRRIKARIATLERAAGGETTSEERAGGVRLVENVEENRLQLIFPGKPPAATRSLLKGAGFRWSPTAGAWQRQLNNAARCAASYVLNKIEGGDNADAG